MLNNLISDFEAEALDRIIYNALDWLVQKFGDESVLRNKLNYTKKHSPLKRCVFKHKLTYSWSSSPKTLARLYKKGYLGLYTPKTNTIYLYCDRRQTLELTLKCLFHEYRHTQQSMAEYGYYKGSYEEHPLEKDANDFADEWLPIYWKEVGGDVE